MRVSVVSLEARSLLTLPPPQGEGRVGVFGASPYSQAASNPG